MGTRGFDPIFLTSGLDENKSSVLCPSHSTPGEEAFGTYWTRGWVSFRATLDKWENRKVSRFAENLKPIPGSFSL